MSTSTSLYLSSEITRVESVGDKLYLWSADGAQYEIPLAMLGQFRVPFAPSVGAELLILNAAPVVKSVSVRDEALHVTFVDGRNLSAPLHWFPRLLHGTPKERQAVEIWGETGLHWEALDEDIDAVQLFKMIGPSAESEASIQRWLAKRSKQQVKSLTSTGEKQLAEKGKPYSAE